MKVLRHTGCAIIFSCCRKRDVIIVNIIHKQPRSLIHHYFYEQQHKQLPLKHQKNKDGKKAILIQNPSIRTDDMRKDKSMSNNVIMRIWFHNYNTFTFLW